MRISFPFLRDTDLHRFLLILGTCSFLTLLYVGGTYQYWSCRGFGEDARVSVIKKVNEAAAKVLDFNTFEGFCS